MHKAAYFSLWSASILLAGAIIFNCRTATADGAPVRQRLAVTTSVTNGNLTLSWPVTPGKWTLWEKAPADSGSWKPAAEAPFQTNDNTVSATLPLPSKTAFYVVTRIPPMRPPSIKTLPPIPPPPTNRPPKFKKPQS